MIDVISPIDNAIYKADVAATMLYFIPIKIPINELVVLNSCSKNNDNEADGHGNNNKDLKCRKQHV